MEQMKNMMSYNETLRKYFILFCCVALKFYTFVHHQTQEKLSLDVLMYVINFYLSLSSINGFLVSL